MNLDQNSFSPKLFKNLTGFLAELLNLTGLLWDPTSLPVYSVELTKFIAYPAWQYFLYSVN